MTIALDEIIAGREPGLHGQPAHHRYVVTIFGLYGRPCGNVIPVSALVRLLTDLGQEAASVRSSISRLKKKGVLVSEKLGSQNGYSLARDLEPHMRLGDERIFAPRTASIGDPWLLASFSVPENERKNRHKIRSGLARLGFGTVAPGLCIAPARLQDEALDYIEKHGLTGYVEFFVSEPLDVAGLSAKIARWWDLGHFEGQYRDFVDAFGSEAGRWEDVRLDSDESVLREAFRVYVSMVTQWRRLPYMDPGLPPELLPADWMGGRARGVFSELHRALAPLSARYAQRIIAG